MATLEEVKDKLAAIHEKAAADLKNVPPLATPEQIMAARKVVDNLLVFFVHDFPWASQIYYLMDKQPVLGMKTMGVRVKDHRMSLNYDPLFVLSLERAEVGYVMVHETFHILFHHCTKRIPLDRSAHQKWNIAADLAINSLIPQGSTCQQPKWHENPVNPKTGEPAKHPNGNPIKKGDRMGVLPKDYNLEDKKSMEWYFGALPEQKDGDGGGDNSEGGGDSYDGSFDSHEGWEPSDLVDQEIANTVERISKNRQWGNMPAEMVQAIEAAQKSEVPWWKVLRHCIGDLISKSKVKTIKKVNRRVPHYPFKGDTKQGVDRVLSAFDTSGSVGKEELQKFLSEVNSLVENEQPVDSLCFDVKIHGKPFPFVRSHKKYDFKGRGGTAFTPVVEFAKTHGYKHLIIFTDGQAECPPHVPGLDILWVLTPEGNDTPPTGYQGRFIKMKKLPEKHFR